MPTLITNAQPASIYREGQLTDDGTWIVVNLKGKGGKYLEWVATGYEAATPAAMGAVVNALTSNSTTDPLAAAQGAALNAADIATFALTPAGLILTKKDGTTLPPVALPITVLDGNDKPVVRTNSTPNVAPTALEVPAPISGDTAQVILADKSIEFWSYTTAWAKVSTISYVTATAFTALYGTITNTSPSATTDAVANWGLLGDAIPTNADRFYFAATALAGGNGTNKTVTGANLKAFLATPDEIVDVSGVTFPIAFPITTLPGAPVFAPATPASTTAVYKIVTGANLAYAAWNGTQYISAPAPVATTVSNTVAGVGAARTISTTINGVTSTPVAIPDANNNILSIGGTAATPTISNDGGTNFVNLPSVPPTTNTLAITKANGAISTVQGVGASQPIPAGTIVETLGYNAAGQAVYQAIPAPGNDFWRSGTGASTPDGVTDPADAISRPGSVGVGFADPTLIKSTLDVGGSFATKTRVVAASATADVILPTDSAVMYSGAFAAPQLVTMPNAALFPGRIVTLLVDAASPVNTIDVTSASSLEIPNNTFTTALAIKGAAMQSITWQSAGNNWRLVNWVERKYCATSGYLLPADAPFATFNSGLGTVVGADYQLPNTISNFLAANANWTGSVILPATNNSTGKFSIYNTATFDENVQATNTDLPRSILVKVNQSIHFEWSNGLWRWIPAPILSQQIRFSPNDIVNGVAVNGNIPSQAQVFIIANGDFAATLTLPPITRHSEILVITSTATTSSQIAITNQAAGATAISLYEGGSVAFTPSAGGWVPLIATAINGHTRYKFRGTFAAPLTGTITVVFDDYQLFVAPGASVNLPAPAIFAGRILVVKKPLAGSVALVGSIDGVANTALSNANESLTLFCDGATWARI